MCAICNPGFQLRYNSTAGVCVNCTTIPGCIGCTIGNLCAKCLPGFTLDYNNNLCIPCVYPCASCQTGSSSLCISCVLPFAYYAADNGTCFTCGTPNCIYCA